MCSAIVLSINKHNYRKVAQQHYELTLVVASDSSNDTVVASMDWEEISR
jgi:hypothetical protein